MSKPEIGISFRSEFDENRLQQQAQATACYPFDVVSVYDDLGDPSPIYPLLTFAKHTTQARLGPACIVLPKYRTLEPIIGDIARLDSLRPGRVFLGFSPGAWMDKIGLKPASPEHVREAVEVSRYLLSGSTDGYTGLYYTVEKGFRLNYPLPKQPIPMMVGSWGERAAAIAGEMADEVKVGGSANPRMVEIIRQRIEVGTKLVGRSIEDVGIVLGAVTVVDEDRERALSLARRRAVVYIDVIGDKDPTAMADFPGEVQAIKQAMIQGDVEGAVRHLPDDLTRRFLFAGTPRDVIRQIEEVFTAGALRVELGTPHGIDEIEGIKLIGGRVLPYFEKKAE